MNLADDRFNDTSAHLTTAVAGTGAEVDKMAGSLLQSHPIFLPEFLGS